MTLLDFLADNTIITNTYNIFDYETFRQRFLTRYAQRVMRTDMTTAQIIAASQNTVDANKDFYRALFGHTIDPYKTWGETSSSNGSTVVNTTNAETTDYTTKNTGTNTTNTGGDSTVTTENSGSTANARNAYNATTPSPTDSSTSTNNGTTSTTYGDVTTDTMDTTTTNGGTKNNTINGTTTDNNSGNRSGWTNADTIDTIQRYTAAYDILIDDIAENILSTYIDLWG